MVHLTLDISVSGDIKGCDIMSSAEGRNSGEGCIKESRKVLKGSEHCDNGGRFPSLVLRQSGEMTGGRAEWQCQDKQWVETGDRYLILCHSSPFLGRSVKLP